ncbi:MAG: hypothetical protein AAF721_39865 [Myxococcota bacterium]
MLGRTLAATPLLAGLALTTTGCFLFPEPVQTAVFQREDVSMDTPGGFRALGEEGEVMMLADEIAVDTNRWVAEMASGFGEMLEELNQHPPSDEDGDWRIYGPEDAEDGEDASWMARVSGDKSKASFEVFVGERGADADEMVMLFSGDLAVEEGVRTGGFMIDFDVIAKLGALQDNVQEGDEFGGTITVDFTRSTKDQSKDVVLKFDGFHHSSKIDNEEFNYKDETYNYHRDAGGAGLFHLATWAPFDDEGWSGPELERVTVDMAWNEKNAGRARAQILDVEGEGDLLFGDVELHECFDAGRSLTWAHINAPYSAEHPEYNEGDEKDCLLEESALDSFDGK